MALGTIDRMGIPRVVRERRFWTIQAMVALVTLFHGVVEASGHDDVGLVEGLKYLPVALYVLPIILAASWYGLEGGLMTGVLALVISVPNLVLWHRTDYEWLGEAAVNNVGLVLGIASGLVADRARRARAHAERIANHLRILQEITSTVNAHDTAPELIAAILAHLAGLPGVVAVRFSEKSGWPGTVATGQAGEQATTATSRHPITVRGETLGILEVDLANAPHGDETELIGSVATELELALDRLRTREAHLAGIKEYARRVTEAHEVERRRIARDLHDGPAQSLVVVARGLGHLPDLEPAQAGELRDLTKSAIEEIREAIAALRPSLLEDLGLVPAIKSLVEGLGRHGIAGTLRVAGTVRRMAPAFELATFRIAQEAIANVIGHAQATTAEVVISFLPDRASLTVSDDGIGFAADPAMPGHFGLMGMRERATIVGGTLDVISEVGSGTVVTFVAPAAQNATPDA